MPKDPKSKRTLRNRERITRMDQIKQKRKELKKGIKQQKRKLILLAKGKNAKD